MDCILDNTYLFLSIFITFVLSITNIYFVYFAIKKDDEIRQTSKNYENKLLTSNIQLSNDFRKSIEDLHNDYVNEVAARFAETLKLASENNVLLDKMNISVHSGIEKITSDLNEEIDLAQENRKLNAIIIRKNKQIQRLKNGNIS